MVQQPDRGKRKRVALLLSSLQGRGVQRVRLTLAQAFLDRGHEVDLVVANPVGAMAPAIPDGVTVHRLEAPRLASAIPKMVRYFRTRGPDAVLSAEDHVNIVAIVARKLSGVHFRLATSVHVTPIFSASKPILSRAHWMRYAVRLLYPLSDQVITVSHDVARDIETVCGFPADKVMVIHNPVDVATTRARAAISPDHPWLTDKEIPVVIGVGALSAMKNFSVLVDAVVEVCRTRPIRLILLGEGPKREELERQIALHGAGDYIQLAGFIANPGAFMMRADVLGLTSTTEAFGNVIIEALACGCPVVSVDCSGGPSEILDNGRFGELVPSYAPAAIAAAICRTLDAPQDPARLVDRAMDFDISVVVERYARVLGL